MSKYKRRQIIKFFLSFGSLFLFPRIKVNGSQRDRPRVFIIGDSISIGYTPFVKKYLEGKAVVTRPPQNCNGTKLGVTKMDEWINGLKYDLIHFNFGLHDMKHVDPQTGKGSLNPKDPVQSELSVYKNNLEIIIGKLKDASTHLIFATTTPVPEISGLVLRESAQLEKYNKAAIRIMKKHGITINDLFGFAMPQLTEIQNPNDVHFTEEGYKILASRVAESISNKLGI